MQATTAQDGRGCIVREEQEPGASGVKVIAAHVILLVGYDYAGVGSTGDKATKAKPFSVQVGFIVAITSSRSCVSPANPSTAILLAAHDHERRPLVLAR